MQNVIISQALSHPENYGIYAPICKHDKVYINTVSIKRDTWHSHYNAVMNLCKDGIETEQVQNGFVHINFADGVALDLAIPDYALNLILWNMLIMTDTPIESKHVFFEKEIKNDSIKKYIDRFLIDENRKKFSNKQLNNVIDDTMYRFHDINDFAMFLANTVNLEDNAFLMDACPEFYECMHADLSNVPIEDIKGVGMKYANRAIEIMKDAKDYLGYDHCLADACRGGQGINPKQFKEFTINIGTKPDGQGGIFPVAINKSFINGGVSTPLDYFIESSTGRTAQIIKYNNVGSSGHFARLLGLNNMDSYLHEDMTYDCGSTNFVTIFIKDKKTLKMLNNRYYRLSPNGVEKIINSNDSHLIGKMIYLRSPITCASAALGKGYCYKCYGDLAYTVYDIQANFGVNIGRIASEILSSSLTQKLLSAKHLLETFVEKMIWSDRFDDLFEIEGNMIRLNSEVDCKEFRMVIDPDAIELENEEDDDLGYSDGDGVPIYNEYVTEFEVMDMENNVYRIFNDQNAKLYISAELNSIIRRKANPIDGKVHIEFQDIKDSTLFIVPIQNNELSKTLEHLEDLLNKNSTIKGMNIHQLLQALIDTVIEGGLNIASTHLEVIVSNQIRDAEDILLKPKWYFNNPPYEILSLNSALTNNPSVTISLSYQKVSKQLFNPLTFKKNGASFMDIFFMEKPQYAIKGEEMPGKGFFDPEPGVPIDPLIHYGDPTKVTEDVPED